MLAELHKIPGGAVKVESVWDGNRLLTVIVKGEIDFV